MRHRISLTTLIASVALSLSLASAVQARPAPHRLAMAQAKHAVRGYVADWLGVPRSAVSLRNCRRLTATRIHCSSATVASGVSFTDIASNANGGLTWDDATVVLRPHGMVCASFGTLEGDWCYRPHSRRVRVNEGSPTRIVRPINVAFYIP